MANAYARTEYPTVEPDVLTIGDRWTWRKILPDYSPSLYTLTYQARSQDATPSHLSLTAVDDGTDYFVETSYTATQAFEFGVYEWTAYITRDSDSERIRLYSGTFHVRADRATSTSDPRTYAQKQIDNLQVLLDSLNLQQAQSYSLGDRSTARKASIDVRVELMRWMNIRARELERDMRAKGLHVSRNHRVILS